MLCRIVKIKRRVNNADGKDEAQNESATKVEQPKSGFNFAFLGSKETEKKQDGPAPGSLFGNFNSSAKTEGTGLFGGKAPAAGSLFGNTGSNGTQAKGESLFGNAPSSGSLFGNTDVPKSGSLFGNTTSASNASGGGLFGNAPSSGSLFGNTTKNAPTSSLFSNQNSLFGGNAATSIFAKPAENSGEGNGTKKDGGDDSDGAYANEEEPPTVVLEDQAASKSPFTKVYEKEVQKFKQATSPELKKNCGQGKVSILKGVFGEGD